MSSEDKDTDTGDKSAIQIFFRRVITSLKGFTTSKGFTSFVDGTKKVYGVIKVKTGSWARDGYSAAQRLFKRATARGKSVCTNCGHSLSNGEKFCSACGTKVPPPPPQETATSAESTPNASPAEPVVPKIGPNVKIKIRKKEGVGSKSSLMTNKVDTAPEATPAPSSTTGPISAPVAEPVVPEATPAAVPDAVPSTGEQSHDNQPRQGTGGGTRKVRPTDSTNLQQLSEGKSGAESDAGDEESEQVGGGDGLGVICFIGFGVGAALVGELLAWCIWGLAYHVLDGGILFSQMYAVVLILMLVTELLMMCAGYAATVTNGWRGFVRAFQGWLVVSIITVIVLIISGELKRRDFQREMREEARRLEQEYEKDIRNIDQILRNLGAEESPKFQEESRKLQDELRELQRESRRKQESPSHFEW